ncbi:MAG: cobalamin-dependent protein, partial [Lachnospiraceae bacterium]|nr:cobalamin-dependent protein [Lachnospiraceae bacterium]
MNLTQNNKVLLIGINAKYIHSNPAVYSLKAYADKYYSVRPDGCILEIAEYTINQPSNAILADLYQKKPHVAAFSCYIWNWNMIQDLLAELPKLLPDTELWLGGPEVSFRAQNLMQEIPQLTGIMVGEGEETFLELLKYYWGHAKVLQDIMMQDKDLSCIKGIVCKDGFTGERSLTDIDKLPFIYNPMLAYQKTRKENDTLVTFKNRIIYYESQRGCPFRCAYCLSSVDKEVRLRNIETVKSELQYFLDCKVPQLKFIDRTFNCNQQHALSIWSYLKENDNGVTNFHFEIAADLLTDSQLEVMHG